jgi:DNA-binding protein HU-beta
MKLPKFSPGSAFKAAVDPKAAAHKAAAKTAKPAAKKAARATALKRLGPVSGRGFHLPVGR